MDTTTDRISMQEVRLLLVFHADPDRWLDNRELVEAAQVSPRTASAHSARLAALGILEVERVFPRFKYHLARQPGEEGRAYLERWEKARRAFNI